MHIISLVVYKDDGFWPPLHTCFPLTQPKVSNERTFSKRVHRMYEKKLFFFKPLLVCILVYKCFLIKCTVINTRR